MGCTNIAREARSNWGYAGLGGDCAAIEPAGGGSPLRGGAEVCGSMRYQQQVTPNYRS
jgi:hypothetical protein